MLENKEYALCGGTFFTLLLQARKQRTAARKNAVGAAGLSFIDTVLLALFPLILPPDRTHDGGVLLGIDQRINRLSRCLEEFLAGCFATDELIHSRISGSTIFVNLDWDGNIHAQLLTELKTMPLLLESLDLLRRVVFDNTVKLDFHSFAFLSFLPNGRMQNYARASVRKWA